MSSEKQELEEIINKALEELYEKDKYLIQTEPDIKDEKEYHVSERGIVFRFGIYLNNIMSQIEHLKGYHIDTEFNRNINLKKTIPSRPDGVYPDLIIHKRGTNKNNLIVIEIKTWWNKNISEDKIKIKEFMDINGAYKYKFGLSILIKEIKPELNWIED